MCNAQYRISAVVAMLMLSVTLIAQRIEMPDGEAMVTVNTLSGSSTVRLTATRSTVYSSKFTAGEWSKGKALYQTNPLRRIVDAHLKPDGSGDTRSYAILLDDGTVIVFNYNTSTESFADANGQVLASPQVPQGGQQQYRKVLLGNDVYVQYQTTFYRNKLDGSGWKQDTSGLNRALIQDISLGAPSTLVAGTGRGIFSFNAATATWSRYSSFDTTANVSSVFVARNGRIFLSAQNKGVHFSTDNGSSWVVDTAGIGGANLAARYTDDNANTMYATLTLQGNTSALYRKKDNASAWERIDQSLMTFITQQPRINDLSGEQMLEVATNYGNFTSLDKGDSWTTTVKGIMAEDIYGVEFLPANVVVVSTALGIYRKEANGWTKTYPQNGYSGTRPLYRARYGASSTICFQQTGGNGQQGAVWTSNDAGQSWQIDTVGLSTVPGSTFLPSIFYLDPSARKHIGLSSSQNATMRHYMANPTWAIDTVGLTLTSGGNQTQYCSVLHTDMTLSNEYVGGAFVTQQNAISNTIMFRRSYNGGTWTPDTTGLGRTLITVMSSDKKNLYAGSALSGGSASLFRKTANGWEGIPTAPAAVSDTRSLALDSAGVLFVAYSPSINNNAPNRGVYATADDGKTWDYAGLDSVTVRGLTATSDGMYAFTNRGTYKLSRQTLKAASIQLSKHVINFDTLSVNATRDSSVTITNTGNDTLRVTNMRTNSQNFSVNPTQFNLAPGESRQITITFAPKTLGQVSATLRTVSNTLPDTVLLTGEGVRSNNAQLVVVSKVLPFGDVPLGSSHDSVATVRNDGTDTIKVTNVISNNPVFTVPVSSFDIPPGQVHEFTVRYTPTSLGSAQGRLRILSNTFPDSLTVLGTGAVASVSEELVAQKLQLRVAPNPVSQGFDLHLNLPRDEEIRISLSNMLGQEIALLYEGMSNAGEQTLHFDLQNIEGLTSGMYSCRVHSSKGIGGVKLVINR